MSPYIFRPPSNVPTMTFEGLWDYIEQSRGREKLSRKIGTTVTVEKVDTTGGTAIAFLLYDVVLVTLYRSGHIEVAGRVDDRGSKATTWWLQRIFDDNRIDLHVGRIHGKYPVAGRVYESRARRAS